jgi:hypothetical protein
MLETHSDSFAETLTQTGTFHVHLANNDPFTTFSLVFPTYIGLWVLANPIPEPTIVAQLLAGRASSASRCAADAHVPCRWRHIDEYGQRRTDVGRSAAR